MKGTRLSPKNAPLLASLIPRLSAELPARETGIVPIALVASQSSWSATLAMPALVAYTTPMP